ncbi:MAG: hypothetical protein ACI9SY_000050 [Candidatus Paceibacteria bacterium]|jgi:hypothetical protein
MPTKKSPKKTAKKSVAKKVVAKKAATKQTQKYAAAKKKPASKKVAVKKPVANKVNTRKVKRGELSEDKRKSSRGEGTPGRKVTKAVAIKKPNKDLVFAADQESFWTNDGEILNSLMSLSEAFGTMKKGVYQFHAEGDHNDFSVWVETVLCDGDCAAELAKAKTHKSARTIVNKHLKNYSK